MSSGQRINKASDGISTTATADGASGEISNVLQRLAGQSANGVFPVQQRSALQNEFSQLSSEIDRTDLSLRHAAIRGLQKPA